MGYAFQSCFSALGQQFELPSGTLYQRVRLDSYAVPWNLTCHTYIGNFSEYFFFLSFIFSDRYCDLSSRETRRLATVYPCDPHRTFQHSAHTPHTKGKGHYYTCAVSLQIVHQCNYNHQHYQNVLCVTSNILNISQTESCSVSSALGRGRGELGWVLFFDIDIFGVSWRWKPRRMPRSCA